MLKLITALFAFVLSVKGQVQFRSDYSYLPAYKLWYKVHIIPTSWMNATLRCRFEGASLIIPIKDLLPGDVKNKIEEIFAEFPDTRYYYIGAQASIDNANYFCADGQPLSNISFIGWDGAQPDNYGNDEWCATFHKGENSLNDATCNGWYRYACFRNFDAEAKYNHLCGTIDLEYKKLDNQTDNCYKLHSVPRTYSRAHMVCAAEGGRLANVQSKVDVTAIRQLFEEHATHKMPGNFVKDHAFVGIYVRGTIGDWVTNDGKPISSTFWKWARNNPDNTAKEKRCAGVSRKGLLANMECDKPALFICVKKTHSLQSYQQRPGVVIENNNVIALGDDEMYE